MPHNIFEDQTEQTVPSLLQSKPQRQVGWRKRGTFSIVLLLVGAVIIVGTGIVLAVVLTPHGSSTTNNATTTNNVTPLTGSNKQAKSNCKLLSLNTLLQQTAQGLHLSVAQVKAQIKGGKSIQDVARAQGISAQQLQSIETNALQAANNQMVTLKCTSQAQANANVQYYVSKGAQYMNDRFTYWFANL